MVRCSAPDWDDLLAYTAPKTVSVRHKWVGIVYYVTLIAIVGYVVGYEIIMKKGYTKFDMLAGSVRATLQPAALTALAPIDSLTYCTQSAHANATKQPLDCVSWDPTLTSQSEANSLLIGTRVTRRLQRRNVKCSETAYGCAPWTTSDADSTSVYVGDVEHSTVLLQHAVMAHSALGGSSDEATGLDSFGRRPAAVIKGGGADVTTVPCGSPDNTQKAMCGGARGDLLTVAELLRAAAVDLDALSNSTNKQQKPETIRHAGVALVLTVHYQAGAVVYGDGPKYYYQVNASRIEAKTQFFGAFTSSFDAPSPNATRELYDVHGLQISFEQAGGLSTPDVRTTLLTLITGLALMSVAKTVTDAYLLYLSPRSKDYRLFVRTTTPDFAPDSDAEAQSLADTLAGKRRKMERRLAKHVSQAPSVQAGTAPLMATVPEGQSI